MNLKPELPLEIMEKIVGHCEYPVLQAIRKTNSILRNMVQEVAPRSSITSISIKSCKESIHLKLSTGNPKSENAELLYPKGNMIHIKYEPHEKGCCVILEKEDGGSSTKILENEDYKKIFWQDWEILLQYHGNELLESFILDFEKIDRSRERVRNYDSIRDHVTKFLFDSELEVKEALRRRFKVKNFSMTILNDVLFYPVFVQLGLRCLEGIHISSIFHSPTNAELERPTYCNDFFDQSEQWRTVKRIEIEDFNIYNFDNILHFETIKGRWRSIDVNHFHQVIESIFISGNAAKHYQITSKNVLFMDSFHERYGESADHIWYLRSLGTEMIVEFLLMSPESFQLKVVQLEEVEDVGRIQEWTGLHDDREDEITDSDDDSRAGIDSSEDSSHGDSDSE